MTDQKASMEIGVLNGITIINNTMSLPVGPIIQSRDPVIPLPGVQWFGAPTTEQLRKREARAAAQRVEAERLARLRAEQDAWNYSVTGTQTQRAARRAASS